MSIVPQSARVMMIVAPRFAKPLPDLATLNCCSGYDREHRGPVHGTTGYVERLLDPVDLICCNGFDHKHRHARGISNTVCVFLTDEVRKWSCSFVRISASFHSWGRSG